MFKIQLKCNCIVNLIWSIFYLLNFVFSTIRALNQTRQGWCPTPVVRGQNDCIGCSMPMLTTLRLCGACWSSTNPKRYRTWNSLHLLSLSSHFIHLVVRKCLASKTSLWINWQTVSCTKWKTSKRRLDGRVTSHGFHHSLKFFHKQKTND